MKSIYYLRFHPEITKEPIICNLIKEVAVEVNILRAGIDARKGGFMVIELGGEEASIKNSIGFLTKRRVGIDEISSRIHYDADQCVHCGACTAVCFSGALGMDNESQLVFAPEKCIACSLCLKACPLRLFSFSF